MKVVDKEFRLRRMFPGFLLLLLLLSFLYAPSPLNARATVEAKSVAAKSVATGRAPQSPEQAENYRKLAAAKRRAAENVPAKRDCYLAWARYYDCLAAKSDAGDNRDCGREPPYC
jgi:hypothetical protein